MRDLTRRDPGGGRELNGAAEARAPRYDGGLARSQSGPGPASAAASAKALHMKETNIGELNSVVIQNGCCRRNIID